MCEVLHFCFRFNEARTLMEQIFGQKMHKKFPRTFFDSQICGNGLFPSYGQGNYNEPGISLDISVGKKVYLPSSEAFIWATIHCVNLVAYINICVDILKVQLLEFPEALFTL